MWKHSFISDRCFKKSLFSHFQTLILVNRGKVVLGYNEIELCMKGSGYNFIHAADMMYCADNHIRSKSRHRNVTPICH